ncbi:MAG TPA: PAS domain S-box protein [Oscillatoriaceae cyanobacterium M33_DOE_052]|uniref:histidine kinase n=1 Tax=Planktothricoides sp. SpSt-374 TaxID=2282167 RepID=A0A7C3VQ60_9CYAN|nr:PAS domain S-box protein [Oscillatoriaceae cyanobacterium M33_DOE_052]
MKVRFLPLIAAVSAAALVGAGVWIIDRAETDRAAEEERAHVLNQLSTLRARLEGELNSRLFLTRGLVAYVSNYPDVTQAEFERLAAVILTQQTGIPGVSLYKNTTVSHIYPFQENKAAIGFNPMTVPEEREAVQRAIDSRQTVVAGPVNLIPKGIAFISRTPIFLTPEGGPPESGAFWGMVSISIDRDSLFEKAEVFQLATKLQLAIRGKDSLGATGAVFFGDEKVFAQNSVKLAVSLPNGSWQLAAIPLKGWQHQQRNLWLKLGGGLVALLTGVLVYKTLQEPEKLRVAVQLATEAVKESETKYRELVENASSIILRLDTQGNITFFNEFAQELFGYSEAEIIGKNALGTILPETYSSGTDLVAMVRHSLRNPKEFTHHEREHIRRNGKPVWIAWRNKLLQDEEGHFTGMLCVGTDITDQKRAEAELHYKVEFEKLITNLSTHFINLEPEQLDEEINLALETLGNFCLLDRVSIFLFSADGTVMEHSHEWCGLGIEPQIAKIPQLPVTAVPWFMERMRKMEVLHLNRLEDLPPEALGEKEVLTSAGIKSVLSVPLATGGITIGFISFDAVSAPKIWSEDSIKLLKLMGEILANALQRKRSEVARRESEAELRALFAAMRDVILVLDTEGRYLKIAPTSPDLVYKPPATLLGKTLHEVLPLAQADWFLAEIRNAVATKQMRSLEYSLVMTPRKTDNDSSVDEEIWFSASISPIQDNSVLWVARDISDRKRAEVALQKANEDLEIRVEERTSALKQANLQLQDTLRELQLTQAQMVQSEKMSSLGQLVAGIAHEINNPVNFIHANLSYVNDYAQNLLSLIKLYQEDYPEPAAAIQDRIEDIELDFLEEDLAKILASMKSGTERIRKIVLSLRNFSRLDEAEMKLADIHEGIESTLLILQNRLQPVAHNNETKPEIEIVKEFGNLPLVECYPGQLNQVFLNLLNNAIDAIESVFAAGIKSPPEPGKITITTEVIDDQRITISISDNGIGIQAEAKQKLFNPFFTTKAVGKGTGLGLSIAYQVIVEMHGGEIICCSDQGSGTTFKITLNTRTQKKAG